MGLKHFFYTRKETVKKLDENGKPIPLTRKVPGEEGKPDVEEPIPGKFVTEVVEYTDSFNTDLVIRTHRVDENKAIVLLSDGHESTETIDYKLKNPKGARVPTNMEPVRGRVWIQSEIVVEGKELEKLYEVLKQL